MEDLICSILISDSGAVVLYKWRTAEKVSPGGTASEGLLGRENAIGYSSAKADASLIQAR